MITAHTIMNQRWAFCQKVLGGSAAAAGANGAGLVGADAPKAQVWLVRTWSVFPRYAFYVPFILNLCHAERRQKRP
jgi:hypothetical protein